MYEIAEDVLAWQQAGERFVVVRAIAVEGFGRSWRSEALAVAAAGGRSGSVLADVAHDQVEAAAAHLLGADDPAASSLLTLVVPDSQAEATGLICGGTATLLLQRENCLPEALWPLLCDAGSAVLFTVTDEPAIGRSLLAGQLEPAGSLGDSALDEAAVEQAGVLLRTGRFISESREIAGHTVHVAVLFPVPELVIVGDGHLAEALKGLASGLDWLVTVRTQAADTDLVTLPRSAAVVVLSHDLDLAGPALASALASRAGYVGAVGSRKTQAGRAEWLGARGVSASALGRIHGPAGLDLGARTPAEIALSVCAEILAEREGRSRTPLSRLSGPIHQPVPQPD